MSGGHGRVWEVLRVKVDCDIADWISALPAPAKAIVALLEQAFDAHYICDHPPIEDLPPRSRRSTLTYSIPKNTHAILIWWAQVKGVTATSILRVLLRQAYEDCQQISGKDLPLPLV